MEDGSGRRGGGVADDEFGVDGADLDAVLVLHVDESVEGGFRDFVARDADGGEGWLRVGTDGDVVKANE